MRLFIATLADAVRPRALRRATYIDPPRWAAPRAVR